MVDFVSSLGDYLGNVEGFEFHAFPSLERLALVTEQQLREAGFGYRAKICYWNGECLAIGTGRRCEMSLNLFENCNSKW
ncbi:hypothetical protein OIU76_001858 [Salix suchowensis]|nr:hypothetical protein OIU76_001858 [Salix suchowensis]